MKTFIEKLQDLQTKKGEIKDKYSLIVPLIERTADKIRPVHATGSGRFTKNADHTAAAVEALNLLGVDFEQGNDAPRGGATGNFIALTAKGRRQVAKYAADRKAIRNASEAERVAALEARRALAAEFVDQHGDEIRYRVNRLRANAENSKQRREALRNAIYFVSKKHESTLRASDLLEVCRELGI